MKISTMKKVVNARNHDMIMMMMMMMMMMMI